MTTEVLGSGASPGRRRSILAYVVFALGAAGLGAVVLARRIPLPLEVVLSGAAVFCVAAFACRRIVNRRTLTTHRHPKNGIWASLGVGLGALGILGIVWVLGTQSAPRKARGGEDCADHMRRIVGFYRRKAAAGELESRHRGALRLVRWMREFASGEEHVLICPTDLEYPYLAEDRELYHDDLRPDHEVRARVSYALRDFERFPVGADVRAAWIVCCRQGLGKRRAAHGDGLHVGFADGTVRLVTREELDVPPGEPIHAGVRSRHAELQAMLHIE